MHIVRRRNEEESNFMKRIAKLIIGLVFFGTLPACAFNFSLPIEISKEPLPAVSGVLRPSAANPHYFTDSSGKAIYLAGSHTWTGLIDRGPIDPPPR